MQRWADRRLERDEHPLLDNGVIRLVGFTLFAAGEARLLAALPESWQQNAPHWVGALLALATLGFAGR